MEKLRLKVEGMTCVNCAKAIEVALKRLKGVNKVEVSFELGRVFVEYNEEFIGLEDLKRVIEELGYQVVESYAKKSYDKEILVFSFTVSLLIMVLMFLHHPLSFGAQAILSIMVQIVGGYKFYQGAFGSLKVRVGNMELLVALGTTSALLYSLLSLLKILPGEPFFETNAFLISFVRLGKYVEEKTKGRALNLLRELFAIQTSKIRLITSGGEKEVSLSEVLPGDLIILKTGDLVPLDGEIVEGKVEVDESLVTGESRPVLKEKGSSLVSGSMIVNGFAKVKVKALLEQSYVSLLISLVEEALKSKPRIQRIADVLSHYFVQIIVFLSLLVLIFWYIKSRDIGLSFNFALSLLVISCPCAFGLAVPLAISMGLVRTFKKGLLIKDPSVFEKVKEIKVLILDKTGTLTLGKPKIVEFKAYNPQALQLACNLASTSQHPYSKAIVEYGKTRGIEPVPAIDCREEPGLGIICDDLFLGRDIIHGNLVLRQGERILAEIRAEDEIRPEAREIIRNLNSRGIELILATGDTKQRAEVIAKELGIAKIHAGVSPKEKLHLVEEYQGRGLKVAMIGDGVNDAPALAKADLSFVMAEGVDLSKRVGEVVLLSGLKGLQDFFEISHTVRRRIVQNLFWAFIYNLLGIPIAGGLLYSMGIILKPEIAGLMMALSSISVVLNSIRK
ncbi:MAG: cation-translocating P-type ATPase [Caldimicrobium sp.]|nr:cation-translocating P-type ATPase [Caldimicrobium sp.]MCX7612750.1 cation-translocating P-type ATPase [Caldimicrobium sp.]MDW8183320.1 cation-translocating P-type ATPase [Caldimicrobium sp.]